MVDSRTARFSSIVSCNRSSIWGNSVIPETLIQPYLVYKVSTFGAHQRLVVWQTLKLKPAWSLNKTQQESCFMCFSKWLGNLLVLQTGFRFCLSQHVDQLGRQTPTGASEPVPQIPRLRDQCWKQNLWISLRAGCRSSDSAIILA